MSLEAFAEQNGPAAGRRLTGLYSRTFLAYLLGMILMWVVGLEALFYHPTPFYALYDPVFPTLLTPAFMVALFLGVYVGFGASFTHLRSDGRPPGHFAMLAVMLYGVAVLGAMLWDAARGKEGMLAELLSHWEHLRWHLLALLVFTAFFGLLLTVLPWYEGLTLELPPKPTAGVLAVIMLFIFLFSGSIAMIRGGPDGIQQAYERRDAEFVGDIGMGGSIRGLFSDYERIHEHLSMHGKVHPPGPTALLWILSYFVGRGPLALSLATMAFGSLAVIPLYLLARDLGNQRIAFTACLIYAVVPAVVLFTATSANILFMPFTIATLFLFWRALFQCSAQYALAAGVFYAFMSLLSFSLIGVGAFFGIAGLWALTRKRLRFSVIQTAALMLLTFLGVHALVWWWSGFDMIAAFQMAKAQFDLDQAQLQQLSPRYPGWAWRILNPLAWFYFAGIPVSILFIWRLFARVPSAHYFGVSPEAGSRGLYVVFFLTLVALNLLYLGRGEGERSAMHIIPFLVIPAAFAIDHLSRSARSYAPLAATLGFLAFQCWFTESYFYTYW